MMMAGLDADTSSYAGYAGTNKLLATANNSPEVANAWLQNAQGQQNLQRGQLQLSQQHLSALNDIVSSVMANPTPENANARLADGVKMGVISPQDAAQESATIASFGGDQNKIRQYAFQHGQPLIDAMQRMQISGMGQPQIANTGNALTPYVSRGGLNPGIAPAAGQPMQLQQTPSELASPVTVPDATGAPHVMTQRQFQNTADPSGQSSPNSYVDPAKGPARVENGKIVYGAPGALPGIAGPAPGIAGAADTTAQAGAAQGIVLSKAADQAPQQRATINNLAGQLDKIATGPYAERINTAKAAANLLGSTVGVEPFDPKKISAMEDFRHNAQVLANQQQQQLGGTDAGLAAGSRSNPNLDISTLGNKNIVAALNGLQDAVEVKAQSWQKWLAAGNSPATYNQWATEFNKSFSPRAFQYVRLDKEGRADMLKSMSDQDKRALLGAMNKAADNGWLQRGQ